MKGFSYYVGQRRRATASSARANMREASMMFRGEIAPDSFHGIKGTFDNRIECAANHLKSAVWWREFAKQSASQVVEWEGGVQ